MKTALIFGISGQDGAYLAAFLLAKGYAVAGTSRAVGAASFANLRALGVYERVSLHAVALTDAAAGRDWREHVIADASLLRPSDVRVSLADPGKAARELGWRARTQAADLAALLVEHALHQQANGN